MEALFGTFPQFRLVRAHERLEIVEGRRQAAGVKAD
jgi:hypothetical protein